MDCHFEVLHADHGFRGHCSDACQLVVGCTGGGQGIRVQVIPQAQLERGVNAFDGDSVAGRRRGRVCEIWHSRHSTQQVRAEVVCREGNGRLSVGEMDHYVGLSARERLVAWVFWGEVYCNCVTLADMKSSTSSFRISEDLRIRLERTARHMGKGKNWLINRALEEYLNRAGGEALAVEAQRQSLAASGTATKDEEFWQKQVDTTGWN
jgi:predicted DNA-binding protein